MNTNLVQSNLFHLLYFVFQTGLKKIIFTPTIIILITWCVSAVGITEVKQVEDKKIYNVQCRAIQYLYNMMLGFMFLLYILCTSWSEIAGHVIRFLCLQGFRAICLTLTSFFFRPARIRLTELKILGCGVLSRIAYHI